jgi:glycosyltransferase involved in cell wall biosynthesis
VRSVALVVSTYEDPAGLESCLLGVLRQSRSPERVVVADDGSGPATREVIARYADRLPVEHAWQEDRGFRVAAARNRALARCREEYVVLIDGDEVPHRHFIRDHLAAAGPGRAVFGQRCALLGYEGRIVSREPSVPTLLSLFVRGRVLNDRWALDTGIRSRFMGLRKGIRLPRPALRQATLWDTHAGNLSAWRADLLTINGFDERFIGWGGEDWDLADRLMRSGVVPVRLLFLGVCFHL